MPRGGKPKLTPEQDKDIVARYRGGSTIRAIAAVYDVSYTPVVNALKRCGEDRRAPSEYAWQPTPDNVAEVVRLFHEGQGVQKIARTVGTGNDVISRVLREAGIKARFGGSHHRFKKDQVAVLVAEYAEGATLAELARRHGGSGVAVGNALKRAGVEIRPHGHEPKFWTPERLDWLRKEYEAGRSQSDIAEELKYSQTAIARRLRDMGILRPSAKAKGSAHGSWKGGRVVDAQGYVRIKVSDAELAVAGTTISGGYVMEHRLVMARMIGRPLTKDETVHHVNGNKQDNRPLNLQLRQGNHGKGVVMQCGDCGSHNIRATPLT